MKKNDKDMHDITKAQITAVYINRGVGYMIRLNNKGQYYSLGTPGDPVADAMYKTALAAKTTNQKTVWIRYWGPANKKHIPTIATIAIR